MGWWACLNGLRLLASFPWLYDGLQGWPQANEIKAQTSERVQTQGVPLTS